MAGLLDNEFMKVILSGSPYMQAREARRQEMQDANAYSSLLGSPGALESTSHGMNMDTMQQTEQVNNMGGGTGLLGGQMTRPQFNTAVGGIPGYRNMSTNLQMQGMRGEQAMDRQHDDQRYFNQNTTLNQRQMAAATEADRNQGYLYKEMDRAYKNEELYRNTTEMAGNILGSMADENGQIDYDNTNGVQHNQLVVTLAKSILGNEAVNVDDRGAIILAGGAPGYLTSMVAKANGGQLGESDFYNVVQQLQNNIDTGMKRNQQMRQQTNKRIKGYGGNETWAPVPVAPVPRYGLAGKGSQIKDSILNRFSGRWDSEPDGQDSDVDPDTINWD